MWWNLCLRPCWALLLLDFSSSWLKVSCLLPWESYRWRTVKSGPQVLDLFEWHHGIEASFGTVLRGSSQSSNECSHCLKTILVPVPERRGNQSANPKCMLSQDLYIYIYILHIYIYIYMYRNKWAGYLWFFLRYNFPTVTACLGLWALEASVRCIGWRGALKLQGFDRPNHVFFLGGWGWCLTLGEKREREREIEIEIEIDR